jgi:predicted DNA-binding transcriptional regulator YafY
MENIIKKAIQNKHLLEFMYKDELRVVEPYTFGVSKKGNDILSAYQIDGSSSSSSDLGWRLFTLDKIDDIKLSDNCFDVVRSEYNPDDSRMSQIYFTV